MKLFVSIALLSFLCHFVYSQSTQPRNSPYNFSSIIGISRAKFEIKGISTEEYPTLEVRLGGRISRNLSSRAQLKTGLNICFRAKRKSYLIDGNYYGKGVPSLLLDETASKRNHVALEIPLSLNIFINGNRSSLNAGLMGRFWQPNDMAGDILRSRQEIGYIAGASQRISSDVTIGIDFYWGLSSVPLYLYSTQYRVSNRFAQLTLEYTFKKKFEKK